MYPADFPNDPPPLIDPTLLVALILAVIVLMILAFVAGRQLGGRNRLGDYADTPKTIYKAIARRAARAASAPSGMLVSATHLLVEDIETRLGAMIALGGPTGKLRNMLVEALKAEADPAAVRKAAELKAQHEASHGKDGHHAHGATPVSHDGHEAEGEDEDEPGLSAADLVLMESFSSPTINIRTKGPIIFSGERGKGKLKPKPAPPKHDEHPKVEEPKDPSYKDAIRLIRQAVADFSDHWSRGETLRELERLQAQMLKTPPLPKALGGEE